MRTSEHSEGSLLAGATAFGFVLAICGSNAVTALLPRYQEVHGLGALGAAVLFSMYFAALLGILLVTARGALVRRARTVLPVALLIGVFADLLHVAGSAYPVLLFPGRFLTGASVALCTGAAAAVMVAVRGEQGRAFIGTGSLLGAGLGLGASIAIVVFLPGEFVTVYLVHAGLVLACLVAVLVGLRRAPGVMSGRSVSSPALPLESVVPDNDRRSRDPGAYGLGALAWAVGALAVAALPADLLSHGVAGSLLIALCVGGACLLTATLAGAAGIGVRVVRTPTAAAVLLSSGWALVTCGLVLHQLVVVAVGAVIGGLGQTVGYRVGLARLTRGLGPVRQGQVAAGYSAVAYAGAGMFVVLDGMLATWLDIPAAPIVTAVIFVVGALGAGWLCVAHRRGAKTADNPEVDSETPGQWASAAAADRLN